MQPLYAPNTQQAVIIDYETPLRQLVIDMKLSGDNEKARKAKTIDLAFEMNKDHLIANYKVLLSSGTLSLETIQNMLYDSADTIVKAHSKRGGGNGGNVIPSAPVYQSNPTYTVQQPLQQQIVGYSTVGNGNAPPPSYDQVEGGGEGNTTYE